MRVKFVDTLMAIHPAGNNQTRHQLALPSEDSSIDMWITVQDAKRLLAGDNDQELRDRVEADISVARAKASGSYQYFDTPRAWL